MTSGPQGIPNSEHDQLSTAWGHFWWILSGQYEDEDDDVDDDHTVRNKDDHEHVDDIATNAHQDSTPH